MPRVNRAQTETNRREITAAAARLFRERGIDGVSVADLMNAAGLTHGGFYGHFESKEALAAVACTQAFDQSIDRWRRRAAEADCVDKARVAVVEGYLSLRSRDNAGLSCPTAALVNDVARESETAPVRAAYRLGVQRQVDYLSMLLPAGSDRSQALAGLATLVGALLLSRATVGDAISDEFLAAARALLIADSPPTPATRRRRRA